MAIKFCSSCKEGFNLDQFYVDNTKSDGKRCDKERTKIMYSTNSVGTVKTQLSNNKTKQATLDFIFGKSEENPIKR